MTGLKDHGKRVGVLPLSMASMDAIFWLWVALCSKPHPLHLWPVPKTIQCFWLGHFLLVSGLIPSPTIIILVQVLDVPATCKQAGLKKVFAGILIPMSSTRLFRFASSVSYKQ